MKSERRFQSLLPLLIVAGLSSYQLILCYVHTHIMGMNNGFVAAAEGSILLLATLLVAMKKPLTDYALPAIVLAYFIFLFAIRGGEIDPQGIRNLFVAYIIFSLGRLVPFRDVIVIIYAVIAVAFIFAIYEYFFVDQYLTTFNVLQYYAARGLVSDEQLGYLNTNLYTSGMRPSGRTILPFLGDQRVSSIFLEPVSMGNFAAILCMWALSYDYKDWRKSIGFYIAGAFFIIASDSRFASMLIIMLIGIRLVPFLQNRIFLYLLPVIVIAGQAYFASLILADWRMDDLLGRLTKSGNVLLDIHLSEIFGIGAVDELYDMGIPYSLVVFGAPLCILLWTVLVFLRFTSPQGRRMRAMLAIYCIGLLLISGTSFYSSKTAGLLWIMLGCLYQSDRTKKEDASIPAVIGGAEPATQNV